MASNFSFLQHEFLHLGNDMLKAEQYVYTDPMYCAILCRKSLEKLVKWLYDHDEDLELPYDTTLNSLMHEPSFKNVIPSRMFREINIIRKVGNNAAHGSQKTSDRESLDVLRILFDFTRWVHNIYTTQDLVAQEFDDSILVSGEAVKRSNKEKEELQRKYEDTSQELERANKQLEDNEALRKELEDRLQKYGMIKEQNLNHVTPHHTLSEAETRKLYIDALLKEAGWDIDQANAKEYQITGMPQGTGIGYVDYVLWGDDGKPLGLVEAKRTTINIQEGQRQAELYANCLEQMTGQRPVIFYTNGFETYIWDDAAGYPEREVQGFYSKEELTVLINRRASRKVLSTMPVNKSIAGRHYQLEAIKRVAKTLDDKNRGALLVMATGSGKTRTAAAIVDVLTKANWAKKILFLADRNALVTQAKNSFNTHLPNLTGIDLTKEAEDVSSRIVFSTYPTIMNKIDSVKSEGHRYYGVGHFDVVIIDEAHRSVYMKYRAVFEYFDAIFIGLTATPKSEGDKDTYELFGLEMHNPTYAYELLEAVGDKYLVPPIGIPLPLKFPTQGIKYDDLSEDEKEAYEKEFLDNHGTVPEYVTSGAVNKWLFNKDTVDKVLKALMEKGLKVEGGDRLGKTIIFARSRDHAGFIRKRFNDLFPQYAGKMLRIIHHREKAPQHLIDEFARKDNEEFLIATSVDMLDTGIDIPEVLNLVFFKPVRSKAKFWQMVGRGTRLSPDIFGPGVDKKNFYIFDVCNNIEFFTADINEREVSTTDSLSQKIIKAKLHIIEVLQNQKDNLELLYELKSELHAIVASLTPDDFRVRMNLRYVERFKVKDQWSYLSDTDILDIEKYIVPIIDDIGIDEEAKRFDLLMLRAMEALLLEGEITAHLNKIQQTVFGLLKVTRIGEVKQKEGLIKKVLDETYWTDITVDKCDKVRIELRSLMKYIEKEAKRNLYTDFKDEFVGNISEAEFIGSYADLNAYKKRVEKYIRENQHHKVIVKIRENQPITSENLAELENILIALDGISNKETLNKAIGETSLGVFIRNIIGLDVNVAKSAFADFLTSHNLNPDQIHFINTIIDYLSENGVIDNKVLFDKPFTSINDQGIMGLFTTEQTTSILGILKGVNGNAIAAA